MARALRQAARPVAAVPAALEEAISVAPRRQRRALRRIIEEVAVLPVEEQVVIARQVTRQLRGPAARVAHADVEEAAEDTSRTPIAVASSRASVRLNKGLRPVLTSSPALRTLTFEEPAPAVEAAPVARRRVVRVVAPSAYQEVPQAEVVREVRTQRVTGRAGPAVVVETAAASARPRRRPTEWVATLAQGNERSATRGDSSYGLRSVEPVVRRRPRGVDRVVARAVVVPAIGTRGETLVTPSATAFLSPRRAALPTTTRVVRMGRGPDALPIEELATASTQRVLDRGTIAPRAGRRSRLVAAPPTAYVAPIEVVEERVPEIRPAHRRARAAVPPVEEPLRRERPARETPPAHRAAPRVTTIPAEEVLVEERAVPLTQRALARSVVVPRLDDRGDRLLSAPPVARRIAIPEPVPERPTAPTWRAAARGEEPRRRVRALRLAVAPMAHVAPIEEPIAQEAPAVGPRRARRPQAPTVRAARRNEIAEAAPEPSRVALTRAPTSYLRAPVVEEPKQRPAIARPAESERRSRSTVRAAARAVVAPRTDARGTALLTSGATDYLQVAASAEPEGLLSRSPVAPPRVRRMRGAAVDTERIVRPLEPTAAEPAVERPVQRRAPSVRPAPTARAARRLEVARQAEAHAPAPRARVSVAVPGTPAPVRERILVRDARGQVRPMVRVASGAAVYASARLVTVEPVSEPVEVTPLRRATVSRRHAARRPMPHTVVRDDYRWLVPEPAPQVRVEGERRITTAGPVSRDRLQDVLSRVTAVVRAVERADDARVILPATRRTLEGARVVVERVRMRRAPGVTGEVLLRVILPEEVAPVERAERRGEVPDAQQRTPTPIARPLRRAFAAVEGIPYDEAVDRAMSRAQPAPAGRRRTAARTLRTADGRYTPSPARRRLAPEATLASFGLGEPGLPRHHARVDTFTGAVLPRREDEEVAEDTGRPVRPRPLHSTLRYMGDGARPEPRRPEFAPPRRPRPMRRAAPPEALLAPLGVEHDEEPPAWAHRAVHGTSLRRAPEDEVVSRPARRSSGNLFNALARASSPEDVVQVILERGGSIGAAARELPEPAIRLVQRIVRIQEATSAEARYIERPAREVLASRRKRRPSTSASPSQFSTLSRPSQAPVAAAKQRVTSLTQKLMKLIHLAEVERRVAEAQREVRMAPEGAEAAAEGGGREAGGEAGAPNLKKLESDVLAAVIQELDLMKLRRQEDFNDVWW